MDGQVKDRIEEQPRPDEPNPRKPYEPPQVIYRTPLEAMAAVCLPGSGGKGPGPCTNTFS